MCLTLISLRENTKIQALQIYQANQSLFTHLHSMEYLTFNQFNNDRMKKKERKNK